MCAAVGVLRHNVDRYQCDVITSVPAAGLVLQSQPESWISYRTDPPPDHCQAGPCLNRGTCTQTAAGFVCLCLPGFTDLHCQTEMDGCVDQLCMNDGVCLNQLEVGQASCLCPRHFTGTLCDIDVRACVSEPCLNNGTCTDVGYSSFICACEQPYDGPLCENEQETLDACDSYPCMNRATCTVADSNFTCICTDRYTGRQCQHYNMCLYASPCQNGGSCVFVPPVSYRCDCPVHCLGLYCQSCCPNIQALSGNITTITVNTEFFNVFLQNGADGNEWIVLLRRQDGSELFNMTWADYKVGFGSLSGEFWLGNELMYRLTSNGSVYMVRFDMMSSTGGCMWAEYSSFAVASETDKYRLSISGYTGNSADKMSYSHLAQFSTDDQDNDSDVTRHCAQLYIGGWWYSHCFTAKLTGIYGLGTSEGVVWSPHKLEYVDMKIRVV